MKFPLAILAIALSCPCSGAVVSWGNLGPGERDIFSAAANVVQIAAWGSPLALQKDGNVIGPGTADRFPSRQPESLTGIVFVASGSAHLATMKADGTIFAWGDTEAACGFPQPGKIPVFISIGRSYMLGLTVSGEILNQGENIWDTVELPIGLTHAKSVAAGVAYAAAVTPEGNVEVWGTDSWIGDIYGAANVPMDAVGVSGIVSGLGHLVALRENGTVLAWGLNDHGQTDVPAGLRNVKAVAAGWTHSLALLKNGSVVAWGDGPGTVIPDGLRRVKFIAAGKEVSFAITRESPRLRSDGHSMLLEGETGQPYSVECLDSADGWRPFLTVTNLPAEGFRFEDEAPSPSRFYRAVELEP